MYFYLSNGLYIIFLKKVKNKRIYTAFHESNGGKRVKKEKNNAHTHNLKEYLHYIMCVCV